MTPLTPPCPTCGRQRAVTVPVCAYCSGAIRPSIGPAVAPDATPVASGGGGGLFGLVWLAAGAAFTYWLVNNTPLHRLPIWAGMLALAAIVLFVLFVIGCALAFVAKVSRR